MNYWQIVIHWLKFQTVRWNYHWRCVRCWIHHDLVRKWIPLRSKDHPHIWNRMWSWRGYEFPNLEIRSRVNVLPREDVYLSLTLRTVCVPNFRPREDVPNYRSDYTNLEIRSKLTVLPREDVCCCLIVLTSRTSESRDPLEIHSPPLWGRNAKGKCTWSSSLVRTILPVQIGRTDSWPRLPSWRLEGFPLPRNSLGKGFRELGGRTWTLESATSLSQGTMWSIPKTHRNLGQGWLFKLEVKCRLKYLHPPRKCTIFQNPP